MPEGLVDILAELFHDPEAATTLAVRAGFPRQHLPGFKTPILFWAAVVQQAASGTMKLRSLVEKAAEQFQHHPELAKLVQLSHAPEAERSLDGRER